MTAVKVSEVATVLARVKFDRRRLNQELDALCEIDYDALEKRFIIEFVDYMKLMDTVLDSWTDKFEDTFLLVQIHNPLTNPIISLL
jgi:hypothetical protein